MTRNLIIITILIIGLVSGCASGPAELERILVAMDQHDSAEHESVMRAFVEKAQNDDVLGMLTLTSRITIRRSGGEEKQKAVFRSDTIPLLKYFRSVAPGGESTFGSDAAGHYGWKFKRTYVAGDGRRANLQFTILREDGSLVVAYFGVWEKS